MDYERIQKPQQGTTGCAGGGLSPGKLRNMLLGADKRRKEPEDLDLDPSGFDLRSQVNEANDSGDGSSDNCKDVDVVSVHPDCTTSMPIDLEMRMDKVQQRVPIAPFSKPLPSKWDDAQKWIASPTSNRVSGGHAKGALQNVSSRKAGLLGYSRQPSLKIVVEVPEQKAAPLGEPDTKRIDTSQSCKDSAGQKFVAWQADLCPAADSCAVSLSQHDSVVVHSATTYIPHPSTARSVSMRDMGTEMTPIASQEPSRTGTPVKATTPTRSPSNSRPSTPPRNEPSSSQTDVDPGYSNDVALSEEELHIKTRREIMALGQQLGKKNVAAWAGKEDENGDVRASSTARSEPSKNAVGARAIAWEEAEKAKYMARFKREEMKIQAWENHQKAKTEAGMRKIEVEVERLRGRAHDTLMNKLAAVRHKAEEKRATAEDKMNDKAVKTEQQADHIRRTGRVPSSFSPCSWCC